MLKAETKMKRSTLLLCSCLLLSGASALNWQDSGSVRYALDCDFYGNDFRNVKVKGEQCGPSCDSDGKCTHFTWTNYEGGTCWMKTGPISEDRATANSGAVCGYIRSRASGGGSTPSESNTVYGVKATYWAEKSDAGGCQMPQGSYDVTDALALGQANELGALKWRQGLCGQVLRVDCGNGPVDAVVASTCNLGSASCGVDLIGKTWRRATGGKPPGEASCRVSLTNRNPISGGAPLCYHRPNSDIGNAYYTALGVLNTGGRVSSSAKLAGISGRRNNDGWFEFSSGGGPLFGDNAQVQFSFEDGSSVSFRVGDCKSGGQPNIFS